METFPVRGGPEAVRGGPEVLPQPDLLAAYADREVNIFGITGTFKDLAGMCPVDLNDPRVTIENKNEFIVKAANEAGLEVEPEHEEIFHRVTEQFGLDRKFTVAKHDVESTIEKISIPVQQTVVEKKASSANKPEQPDEQKSKPLVEIKIQLAQLLNQELVRSLSRLEPGNDAELRPIYAELGEHPKTPETPKALETPKTPKGQHNTLKVEQGKPQPSISVSETRESAQVILKQGVTRAQGNLIETDAAPLETEVQTHMVEDAIDTGENPATVTNELVEPVTIDTITDERIADDIQEALEIGEPNKSSWASELSKEPAEVYEDFVVALNKFSEFLALPSLASTGDGDGSIGLEFDMENSEMLPLPSILTTTVERLSELDNDEKLFVAPILKNIVGAIHGIGLLENRNADIETIAGVRNQLRELCVTLFDALEITYTDMDIEQFIEVMLHHKFQPAQSGQVDLDLEYTGTREAKWHFPTMAGTIDDIENELQRVLGMFAVGCARTEA